jgi:uncharacterized protein YqeY
MKGIKMSEILKQIREDLKTVMGTEIQYRKMGADKFLAAHPNTTMYYDVMISQKNVSRAIISMFPEIGKKPADATDDDTIKLLKKYIKNEKERLLYTNKHITESDVNGLNSTQLKALVLEKFKTLGDKLTSIKIKIAQKYLPKQATKYEITLWIHENIDFSLYKNKMQAMGPIMKQFKGCDGNFVKNLLIKLS